MKRKNKTVLFSFAPAALIAAALPLGAEVAIGLLSASVAVLAAVVVYLIVKNKALKRINAILDSREYPHEPSNCGSDSAAADSAAVNDYARNAESADSNSMSADSAVAYVSECNAENTNSISEAADSAVTQKNTLDQADNGEDGAQISFDDISAAVSANGNQAVSILSLDNAAESERTNLAPISAANAENASQEQASDTSKAEAAADSADAKDEAEEEYDADNSDGKKDNNVGRSTASDTACCNFRRTTFDERLAEAPEESKALYEKFREHALSIGCVRGNVSKQFENFNLLHQPMAKINVHGKTLSIYLAATEEILQGNNYKRTYLGDVKKHERTPYLFKIRGERSLINVLRIMDDIASALSENRNCSRR